MDDFDDAMFSYALREEFPNVIFKPGRRMYDEPDLKAKDTIPETDQSMVHIWFPHDTWEPIFFPHDEYRNKLIVINRPHTFLYYYRTHWDFGGVYADRKWVFSFPVPNAGHISTGRQIWDDELKAFRSKIIRILGKLSTNRLKHWEDRKRELLYRDARRCSTWAGYRALQWCRGGPRRMIGGIYRPCDDWKPKETDWYLSLKEKVIAKFGPDYGGPREFIPGPPGPFPRLTTRRE